jgi:hypothetical protein
LPFFPKETDIMEGEERIVPRRFNEFSWLILPSNRKDGI